MATDHSVFANAIRMTWNNISCEIVTPEEPVTQEDAIESAIDHLDIYGRLTDEQTQEFNSLPYEVQVQIGKTVLTARRYCI
jgi:hypothetical protein